MADCMEVDVNGAVAPGTGAAQGVRLVHLDLKGAPPKMSYYEQLLPMLKKMGGTGLLIEYEDMFPYWGELKDIAAPNAYSIEEVKHLLQLAKDNDLDVIPLVQTYGHFEFVLKHDKFKHLREVPIFPMTLCPLREGSMELVQQMIDQVMELHPDVTWFHIGADEVFHIGMCKECAKNMKNRNIFPVHMFFSHVHKVLEYIKTKYPDKRAIMWDDMFREVDVDVIKKSGIGDMVEPMVWHYQQIFSLPPDLWERYSAVFPNVWVASAFKGATGPCQYSTNITYHLENHRVWMNLVESCILPKFKCFRGYALTGWQRYDHYAVLCEVLPVALPCLACCLQALSNPKKNVFTEQMHRQASDNIGCKDLIPMQAYPAVEIFQGGSPAAPACDFPGSKIFIDIHLLLELEQHYKGFMKNERLKGWFTEYHLEHNFTNPAHLMHFLPQAEQIMKLYEMFREKVFADLNEVFYPNAVEELVVTLVNPRITKLHRLIEQTKSQIDLGGAIKDGSPEKEK